MFKSWQRTINNLLSEPYGLSFTLFVLAVIPGVIGAKIGLLIVPSSESGAVAAVTEPLTTKFLPGYIAIHIANSKARQQFLKQPIVFGLWGGFSFGLAERVMYYFDGATPLLLWIVSIGLHAVFGVLVAGTLYWRGTEPWYKQDIGIILLGISIAATAHYAWNVIII
ncbi:PrsW family glutamic-type intramembrane protease [Haloferax volcanii]|uniref:PrsW family glutamic-type intramembrane protease n=1 Tax=Haloferax volcanii TaxID=2246 RepID=UPI0023DB276C|nr:PrsW family glutamic-type intramembrane protease [Haloferax lucentense]